MTVHSYRNDFAEVRIGRFWNRVIYKTCYTSHFI